MVQVQLVESAAENAQLSRRPPTRFLICGFDDVMRSPPALVHVLRHLRDHGRVVAAGPKWAPWWRPDAVPLNLATWSINRPYVTTFEGFEHPWSRLAALVPDLEVEEVYGGGGYIAAGTWRRSRLQA